MAVHTQYGERSSRLMASSSLISPALRSRSTAYNSSSCSCSRWRSQRKEAEKAYSCSAASTNHCSTVVGATSKTRAVARMPKPSANQTGQDAHDELGRGLFAVEERAMGLQKVALTRGTVELPPRAAAGMPCTIREERRVQRRVK